MSKVTIKLYRSLIGCTPKQKACVRGLGLRKIGSQSTVDHSCPKIKGMISIISHMIYKAH